MPYELLECRQPKRKQRIRYSNQRLVACLTYRSICHHVSYLYVLYVPHYTTESPMTTRRTKTLKESESMG